MKTTAFVRAVALLAALGYAAAVPAVDPPKAKPAPRADGGLLIDKSSRPKRVDAGECVNEKNAACVVSVKIGDKCAVTLSPEVLLIRQKGSNTIAWRIETRGYTFPEKEGVQFKGDAKEFDPGRRENQRIWTVRNKGEFNGVWRYGITVVDDKGGKCTIDPEVVTDWG